jgi:hypothetical protein
MVLFFRLQSQTAGALAWRVQTSSWRRWLQLARRRIGCLTSAGWRGGGHGG